MNNYETPEPPLVTLGRRYRDKMDGCGSKIFCRVGYTKNRDTNSIVIPFNQDEAKRKSPKVSIPTSILQETSKEHDVKIVFLYHTESGVVYEYKSKDFSEKPYEIDYGEERRQPPRGLRSARYRWELDSALFTNKSFAYP